MKFLTSQNQPLGQSCLRVGAQLVVGIWLLTGCGKSAKPVSEAAAPAPEITQQAAKDHMPNYTSTASPVAVPAVTVVPNSEPDLGELNRGLLRWLMRNHRRPANFEDFAATAGVAIPPAPAGKKYVISKDMHIQLVKP